MYALAIRIAKPANPSRGVNGSEMVVIAVVVAVVAVPVVVLGWSGDVSDDNKSLRRDRDWCEPGVVTASAPDVSTVRCVCPVAEFREADAFGTGLTPPPPPPLPDAVNRWMFSATVPEGIERTPAPFAGSYLACP